MAWRSSIQRIAWVTLMVAASLSPIAKGAGTPIVGENVTVACHQSELERLDCGYRFLRPSRLMAISASLGDLELPAPSFDTRDPAEGISVVLMLIDTSGPSRQDTVTRITRQIKDLLDRGQDQHQFRFATFDNKLRMLNTIGTDAEELYATLDQVRATGKTTELYRSALEAVRVLAAYPADRRALFLFSDGQAEDRAYFHRDVVAAALEGGVAIYGIGYARSVSLSVALQSLRRLADETGGRFVVTDDRLNLPEDFTAAPFVALDSGGTLSADISQADREGISGDGYAVHLVWTLADGTASIKVPVDFSLPPGEPVVRIIVVPKIIKVEVPVPAPMTAQERSLSPLIPLAGRGPASLRDQLMAYLPYLILGAGIVILPLGILLTFLRRRSGEAVSPEVPVESPAVEPFAFLELRDGSDKRYPIKRAAFRIGRHQDNELMLSDPSISRYHAEIRRQRDGALTVTDLDSLNGLFVNNEKVASTTLTDGDTVEVGDVAFKFSIPAPRIDDGDEQTIALKTAVPQIPLDAPGEKSA